MAASTQEAFHRVPNATPIDEELLPGYKEEDYYPATIGETLKSRYRIICKLGRGVGSTVWLAKDVETSQYRAIKVCIRTKEGAIPPQASQKLMWPNVYRAPEVILGMEWSSKVDLWSLRLWDLLKGKRLFHAKKDGVPNDDQHLAQMVSLMGNPPPEMLRRSNICARYFCDTGSWKGTIPIPDQSFEDRISQVHGKDKELLLGFVRSVPCWLPDQRPTAEALAYDDFLMQAYYASQSKHGES